MNRTTNNIAIITARGGSKRIPRKNIKPFLDKPIIAYSISAALGSGLFQEVMVSTDDKEIAAIAKQYGASVPFERSAANADDHATTADVLLEVLNDYKKIGREFDFGCCIYPTAPFVNAVILSQAYNLIQEEGTNCVLPVTRYDFSIWRSLKQSENGFLQYNWPEHALTRSQDLIPSFHDCGQFYFFRVPVFLRSGQLVGSQSRGLEVNSLEVQDIDTENDWKLAELKYQLLHGTSH